MGMICDGSGGGVPRSGSDKGSRGANGRADNVSCMNSVWSAPVGGQYYRPTEDQTTRFPGTVPLFKNRILMIY